MEVFIGNLCLFTTDNDVGVPIPVQGRDERFNNNAFEFVAATEAWQQQEHQHGITMKRQDGSACQKLWCSKINSSHK